jgi:hypothetical protein
VTILRCCCVNRTAYQASVDASGDAVVRSFSTTSRPALRAAAYGGRPRPANHQVASFPRTAVLQGPTSPAVILRSPARLERGRHDCRTARSSALFVHLRRLYCACRGAVRRPQAIRSGQEIRHFCSGLYPSDRRTPNVGVEATDSDVVPAFADEFSSIARSHVFEMVSGSETVIDIGLTEEPST